jgi:hypothetical protein
MNTSTVRAMLAVGVVGVFMVITAVMALYPLFSNTAVPLNDYADFFAKTASVYTGMVGVIVGYYFGRATDAAAQIAKSPGSPTDTTPAGGG